MDEPSNLPAKRPEQGDESDHDESEHVERIIALVLARVENRIEHLHMPLAVPSAEEAEALKLRAPEVYALWLKLAEKQADDESELAKLPITYTYSLSKRAQYFGLGGLFGILGFSAYLASLGGAAKYIAGAIAALNVVGIIGAFNVISRGSAPRNN